MLLLAKSDSVLHYILTSGNVHTFGLFFRALAERHRKFDWTLTKIDTHIKLLLDTNKDQYSHQVRIQTLKKIDVKGRKKKDVYNVMTLIKVSENFKST